MQNELFFSLEKTAYVANPIVRLSDICKIFGASAEPLVGVEFEMNGPALIISALDVMARLTPLYPEYTITSLGPPECSVFLNNVQKSKLKKAFMTIMLCLVMFFGGAVAIMTFHEDVDMPGVHQDIYAFFTGERKDTVPVVSIPYSIGIAVGFIMLFGLYRRKKSAPTVLDIDIHNHEVDLRNYLSAKSKRPDG